MFLKPSEASPKTTGNFKYLWLGFGDKWNCIKRKKRLFKLFLFLFRRRLDLTGRPAGFFRGLLFFNR